MLTTRQAAFKMNVSIESVRNYILKGVKDKGGKLIKLKAEKQPKGTRLIWYVSGESIKEFQDKFIGE
jgi:hypothetical protein